MLVELAIGADEQVESMIFLVADVTKVAVKLGLDWSLLSRDLSLYPLNPTLSAKLESPLISGRDNDRWAGSSSMASSCSDDLLELE